MVSYGEMSREGTSTMFFTNSEIAGSLDEYEALSSSDSMEERQLSHSTISPNSEVTLAWDNLSVHALSKIGGRQQQKMILNEVSGAVKAGSLVAIMGSSGAGKSTLMSALAYRSTADKKIDGKILINGRQLGNYMRILSGYMYQEDLLLPYLTVSEHMNIMANLKLDRRITQLEKKILIKKVLRQLGLLKCIDSRIGGNDDDKLLSGGEKKRLAFATELLTDPQILFCDEPTTGLDSYSAHKLVTMMNEMVMTGKTILCTIHQPSSDIFVMFSQLILVADGRIAYMGSTNNALKFFESLGYTCPSSYNPADLYIKVLSPTSGYRDNCKKTIKRICDQFAVSDYAKEVDIVVQYELHLERFTTLKKLEVRNNFEEISWVSKIAWLTYRWSLEILRNPSLEATRILQRIFIGLIVGFCYIGTETLTQNGIQSVEGIIFMFVSENTFNPMYAVLHEFPLYLPLFLREYKSGLYHPFTYYVSRILSMLPGFLLQPFTFVITAYWLAGLRTTGYAFLMTLSVIILTMNVSSACGIMFSNAFDSVPTALAYLVPFDYVHMITSGVFLKLGSLPTAMAWVKYLSWLMYSTEALNILQWKGVLNITCGNVTEGVSCIKNGTDVLAKYDFTEDDLIIDVCGMLLLLVFFYILGYIFLWRRVRHY
ncbi:protein scarlet [Diorhabda sublineata]|uniref:protein scarlet n=1 Tax=Diorhabda sublineata TaxID=1163346 RepID=UPI0024E1405F|nr:protein scarlet [Diorhabda sublineata]